MPHAVNSPAHLHSIMSRSDLAMTSCFSRDRDLAFASRCETVSVVGYCHALASLTKRLSILTRAHSIPCVPLLVYICSLIYL